MFKSTQCSLASVLSTLLYTIITGDVLFERMKILCKNLLDVKDTKDFNDILFIVEIIGKREMVEGIQLPKNYIKRFYIDFKIRVNLNEDSLEVVKAKFITNLLKSHNRYNNFQLSLEDGYYIQRCVIKTVILNEENIKSELDDKEV